MSDAGAFEAQDVPPQPGLTVRAQYVVDISFENPNAPASLVARETPPQVSVGVDVQARGVSDGQFEVALKIAVRAAHGDETMFAVELLYAGLFALTNIPAESLQPILLIECPRLLFPFARRIIADLTRDGGFPPLMLEPIDFVALYQAQIAQAQAAQEGNTGQVGHA